MNALGFIYVNKVNLQREASVFRSDNDDNWDLFMTVFILAPINFWSSAIVTWRSRHAMDHSLCPHWSIHAHYDDC